MESARAKPEPRWSGQRHGYAHKRTCTGAAQICRRVSAPLASPVIGVAVVGWGAVAAVRRPRAEEVAPVVADAAVVLRGAFDLRDELTPLTFAAPSIACVQGCQPVPTVTTLRGADAWGAVRGRCGAGQCGAVQCGAARCGAALCGAARCAARCAACVQSHLALRSAGLLALVCHRWGAVWAVADRGDALGVEFIYNISAPCKAW